MGFVIFLVVMLVIIAFCIFMALATSKASRQKKAALAEKSTQYGSEASANLSLLSGLPLAENTNCQLFVSNNELVIEAAQQKFQIQIDQMIAAQAKSEAEIQKEVTSSAGQAIAGGILFGPVGAIIGGRTKTKKTRVVSYYLIINYTNQSGETAVLAFEGQGTIKGCSDIANALGGKINALRAGSVTKL